MLQVMCAGVGDRGGPGPAMTGDGREAPGLERSGTDLVHVIVLGPLTPRAPLSDPPQDIQLSVVHRSVDTRTVSEALCRPTVALAA